MKEIAKFIREKRMENGISLRQLGKMCGVAFSHISILERGKLPTAEIGTIERILDALGYQFVIIQKPKNVELREKTYKICGKK